MSLTVADGFPYYASLVNDVKEEFNSTKNFELYASLTSDQWSFAYAPGKWTVKQILGHITDHERIMTYRILRFSRRDTTLLPGYDQDVMVNNSRFNELSHTDLLDDLKNVRKASLSLLKSLSPEQLLLTGKAWKYELTVEEFLKATIGHERHHVNVLKDLYII